MVLIYYCSMILYALSQQISLRVRRLLQRSGRSVETSQKMFETEDILLQGLGKNPFVSVN